MNRIRQMAVVIGLVAATVMAGSIDNGATKVYVEERIDAKTGGITNGTVNIIVGVSATVASNIAQNVVAPFTNHQDRTDNPHGITAAQLNAGTNLNETGIKDPCNITSNILTYATSTVLITRAMGDYVSIVATNNMTIGFDCSTYPSNMTALVGLTINPVTFSITWASGSISTNTATGNPPGSGGFTLAASTNNFITFLKPCYVTNLFGGRQ